MSTIRANTVTDAAGTGSPNFPNGLSVASAALTGVPTAPTASVATNTTQIATTAFVLANVPAAGAVYYSQSTEPASAPNASIWYNTAVSLTYLRTNSSWFLFSGTSNAVIATSDIGMFISSSNGNYIRVSTLGDSVAWGTMTTSGQPVAASNGSIAVYGNYNSVRYSNMAYLNTSAAFGTLVSNVAQRGSVSNVTRGVFAGGNAATTAIEYVTIATPGNGTSFGVLPVAKYYLSGLSSATRGVFGGGTPSGNTAMDYITVATASNSTSFGTLFQSGNDAAGISNSTRGVYAGMGGFSTMQYITIATPGNAVNFGNFTGVSNQPMAVSNATRGVIYPGQSGTTEYITVATTGNALSFGAFGGSTGGEGVSGTLPV